ncbi:Protein N-acetyltransferase, RimJ/RimL family [Noviherbaspirillum humi]|uniref:Protein N-acetyltransferase, RimJ/RimL family n=2 Tax=Noviherbaspirillum humi TaxID=1688639 RepID=A0A239FY66_9BURK|nr:Protein N-acetyltransferase, RimJ/RimL family [Noviherbaspirillum humi]
MADTPLLHQWANDPELWASLVGWHFPYSAGSAENWVRNYDGRSIDSISLCIEDEELGLIGTASLKPINWKDRNAFYGIMLGDPNTRGRGLGKDAAMAIMRYAFDELDLVRLDTEIVGSNKVSLEFHVQALGWKIEGVKKDWFYRDGKRHDKVIAGITADDYRLGSSSYWKA